VNLEAIQRAMAAAVMEPLTEDENMREQTTDGRAMTDVAASFIAPNSRLTAFERLEIYNRQYWYRVLGALAEDFPALRAVIGGARFEKLSIAYLTEHPSRSFTLRNLGSKLAEWLADHPEFTGRRHALAVDVARIEWAFVEAFDSAEHVPLALSQIAALDGGSQLALQPHLRLMALNYPADDLVLSLHSREKRQTSEAGIEHEEEAVPPVTLPRLRRRPTWLAAHRVEYAVYYRRLTQEEFLMLSAFHRGESLGEALESAFAQTRITETKRAAHVQAWFATWAELGWICGSELSGSEI